MARAFDQEEERPRWQYLAGGLTAAAVLALVIFYTRKAKAAELPPSPTPDNSGGGGSGGGTSGGATGRLAGRPPNVSGDPEGYNTAFYKGPTEVRWTFNRIGYSIPLDGGPVVNTKEVARFQREWNAVIAAIQSGRIKLPTNPAQPGPLAQLRGQVSIDDVPGANTLNAAEIALINQEKNKISWYELTQEAK